MHHVQMPQQEVQQSTNTQDFMIELWYFAFNSSSSRCSIRQINVCLFASLITVTLKNSKTDQDASVWETEGSVLTDVGSVKMKVLILRCFTNCEPKQHIFWGTQDPSVVIGWS